jgi:hypothetical protein
MTSVLVEVPLRELALQAPPRFAQPIQPAESPTDKKRSRHGTRFQRMLVERQKAFFPLCGGGFSSDSILRIETLLRHP